MSEYKANFDILVKTIHNGLVSREGKYSTLGLSGAFRVIINPLERGERSEHSVSVAGWKTSTGLLQIRIGQFNPKTNEEIGEQLVFETVPTIDVELWEDSPADKRHRRTHGNRKNWRIRKI